jgi:IMP and pyridine-specific 5'-nucleotidase
MKALSVIKQSIVSCQRPIPQFKLSRKSGFLHSGVQAVDSEESGESAGMSVCHYDASLFSSRRRNHMLSSHRKDGLIEWLKELLRHSFVLDAAGTYADTFSHFEDLVEEHLKNPERSQLKQHVPSIGQFHTALPMRKAYQIYDDKYAISQRRHLPPTFNEIRHILNLAQAVALAKSLSLLSFDGDQTLYTDGGNFDDNEELAMGIIHLMKSGVKVAIVTAAGYGLDNTKYEIRLGGLLDKFVSCQLTEEEVGRFYVFGGECNYLFQCSRNSGEGDLRKCFLRPILPEVWQAPALLGPKPMHWPADEIVRMLDIAEKSMTDTISQLRLRAKIIRKERSIGVLPGGDSMVEVYPKVR